MPWCSKGTPDDVIHLATALQFCGFRSVVGAVREMADVDGPDVAEDFYGRMLRVPGTTNFKVSASAHNYATRGMRKRERMALGYWVNFIHIDARSLLFFEHGHVLMMRIVVLLEVSSILEMRDLKLVRRQS